MTWRILIHIYENSNQNTLLILKNIQIIGVCFQRFGLGFSTEGLLTFMHVCLYIQTHMYIWFIHVYINLDKSNIYNLSLCVSVFICGTLYLSAWDCADNFPEASALTFFWVAFKCLLPWTRICCGKMGDDGRWPKALCIWIFIFILLKTVYMFSLYVLLCQVVQGKCVILQNTDDMSKT